MNQKRKDRSPAAVTPTSSGTGRLTATGGRLWCLRLLVTVGFPLAVAVLIEMLLRLAGCGYSSHFFLDSNVAGHSVVTDNQDFGRRFFPSELVRYPHPFTMLAAKPRGTLRIFVLGESAAMGDPDAKFGMPRMLEVLLRERFPNRRIEVINTAMVAINSHAILPIARECAERQGDLWIIYMGNNEVIGPYGSASVFGVRAPALSLVRAGLWIKTTRLGQVMDAGLNFALRSKQSPAAWAGMEMMAGQKVRHDSPATARVYQHFERNLSDILETGSRAGVPMVLCTVATNLKDCAPFASLHRVGLGTSELAQWQAAFDAGVSCQNQGKLVEAKTSYEQAARIDDEYAELSFRRATCCLQLGQSAEAAALFRHSRDLDALQFRAAGPVNEAIRQSVYAVPGRSINLVDAEQLFATNSPQESVGDDPFYEHVHLTPEGNYLLTRAVAEQAAKTLALEPSGFWASQSECLRLVGLTDWSRYDALDVILDRIQRVPFTSQVNHAQELQRVTEQRDRYRVAAKPARVQRELQEISKLVAARPEDPDLRWNMAALMELTGDVAGAEGQWRALVTMQPQAALPRISLAKLLDRLGRQTEAYPFYKEGLRINPEYHPARYALGVLCLEADRVPEAIHHLKILVRQKPLSVEGHLALGKALARSGQRADAESQLREVLRLDPNNTSAHEQLQNILGPSAGQ